MEKKYSDEKIGRVFLKIFHSRNQYYSTEEESIVTYEEMRQRSEHLPSHNPAKELRSVKGRVCCWSHDCISMLGVANPSLRRGWANRVRGGKALVALSGCDCSSVHPCYSTSCLDCAFLFQTKDINSFRCQSFALLCEQINCTTLSTLEIHRICEGTGLRHACHYSLHIYTSCLSLVTAAGCTQVNSIA